MDSEIEQQQGKKVRQKKAFDIFSATWKPSSMNLYTASLFMAVWARVMSLVCVYATFTIQQLLLYIHV